MEHVFSATRPAGMKDGAWAAAMLGWALLAVAAHVLPVHAATVVGATPGSHQVTPSGAFTYTIPIAVPPGVAGIEPKLSLAYNSQGGNGLGCEASPHSRCAYGGAR